MNRAGLDMVDAESMEQVKGLCVYPLITEEFRDVFRDMVEGVFRGERRTLEYNATGLKGRPISLYSHAVPLRNEKGEIAYLLSATVDITERKLAEEKLRLNESRLAESQRIAHIGSWEHNLTTNKVVWSDELFRLLGLDPEKDPGDFNAFFNMIHPEDQPFLKKAIEETLRTGKHFSVEYRFNRKDGKTRMLHAQAELISDPTGTQKILSGTGQDITERKEAEDKIKEALKEKEVLLKEIHHRVKNNMAIVSALLKLQSRYSGDRETRKLLEDCQNRINSMALVHEKLYESQNLSSIGIRDYLKELVDHLLDSYTSEEVQFKLEIDDIQLDIDRIIPLGLILNELLTNSIKHAFEGGMPPWIGIRLSMDDGAVSLVYRDSGPGLPEGTTLQEAESLGLKIIYMLAHQLKGSIDVDEADRSMFTLSFPLAGGGR